MERAMLKPYARIALAISLLVAASISCSLLSGIGERVSGYQATAQSISTSVQQGRNLVSTARSVVTQVQGNPWVQTAEAVAREQGPSLLATFQAVATEQGPSVQATLQAFATDQLPGLMETAQSYATQAGPGLQQTASALATRAADTLGSTPQDIPIIPGEKTDFLSSQALITYITSYELSSVMAFYMEQMPANGWNFNPSRSSLDEDFTKLFFEKIGGQEDGRQASVVLASSPTGDQTIVLITIQNQ
jgi:hypothetical protein